MTPTFLESNDRIGIIGTPGGSRIISMVLISSLEFVDGKRPQHGEKGAISSSIHA